VDFCQDWRANDQKESRHVGIQDYACNNWRGYVASFVSHGCRFYRGGIRQQDPHLASALLNHTDPRVTEEHYNRATSVQQAANVYGSIIEQYRNGEV
jgi:hypothetical protein